MKRNFLFATATLFLIGFLVGFFYLAGKLPKKATKATDTKVLLLPGSEKEAKSGNNLENFVFYEAVKEENLESVFQLLKKEINVNIKDRTFGWTPLHWATAHGNLKLISTLLDKGADINAEDNNLWTPLHEAVSNGNKEVASLLLDKGADVNAEDNNLWTPLHEAISISDLKIAVLLLERGADVNKKDTNLWTPLELAKKEGNRNLIDLLSKYNVAFKLKLLVSFFLLAVLGFLALL